MNSVRRLITVNKIINIMTSENNNTYTRTDERVQRIRSVLEKRQTDLTVVLENIDDPHNLSACLRSCDAVGVLEVHLVYYGGQPFPKIGKTSSASAKKWIYSNRIASVEDCVEMLRHEGRKIYTTHMSKPSVSLYDLDFTEPAALVFGNEHDGVSDKFYEHADGNFLIPQVGMIQSLNISVACAVSLYEVYRQRMRAGMYDEPGFSPERLRQMMDEWLRK